MADKIASMMAAGWVSIPEVKWDAMKARAARADKLEVAAKRILHQFDVGGDSMEECIADLRQALGDAAPEGGGEDEY